MDRGLALTLASLSLLAACSSGSDSPTRTKAELSPIPSGALTIDFAVSAAGDHVLLDGSTNLPDGTLVTVGLGRLVKFKGEGPRNFHVGGDGVKVKSGKFTADLEVDESLMIDILVLPADETSFGPLESVSDLVSACVQVRPNDGSESPQPKSVMKVIGKDGANFGTSPQKSTFGDALRLETFKIVELLSPALGYIGQRLGKKVAHGSAVGKDFCSA